MRTKIIDMAIQERPIKLNYFTRTFCCFLHFDSLTSGNGGGDLIGGIENVPEGFSFSNYLKGGI